MHEDSSLGGTPPATITATALSERQDEQNAFIRRTAIVFTAIAVSLFVTLVVWARLVERKHRRRIAQLQGQRTSARAQRKAAIKDLMEVYEWKEDSSAILDRESKDAPLNAQKDQHKQQKSVNNSLLKPPACVSTEPRGPRPDCSCNEESSAPTTTPALLDETTTNRTASSTSYRGAAIVDNNNNNADCAICLARFRPGQPVCQSKNRECRHVFHVPCMVGWLLKHPECPVCRQDYVVVTTTATTTTTEGASDVVADAV